MAVKTTASVISTIRFRGDYSNTKRFPDANIIVEMQASFAELYQAIAKENEGFFDIYSSATTTANTDFVALPANTWLVRAVDILDSGQFCELEAIGIKDRNRYQCTPAQPCAYRLTARGIDLYPTPDAVYTLRVLNTPSAPTMGDTFDFYNGWEEYVVYATLLRLSLNEEGDRAPWIAERDRARAIAITGANGRRSQSPQLIPLDDDMGYWSGYGWP